MVELKTASAIDSMADTGAVIAEALCEHTVAVTAEGARILTN